MMERYRWLTIAASKLPIASKIKPQLPDAVNLLVNKNEATLNRKSQQGVFLFTCQYQHQEIAIAYSDFRLNGGSFGQDNSQRLHAFIEYCREAKTPLVMVINSMGVSFLEGRSVFNDAFPLILDINALKQVTTVFTLALSNCYGLGAVFFSLGHYRIGIDRKTQINLTGPLVFKKLLGSQADFKKASMVESSTTNTALVHDIVKTEDAGFENILRILAFVSGESYKTTQIAPAKFIGSNTFLANRYQKSCEDSLSLLSDVFDSYMELFPSFDNRLKIFLARTNGRLVGVFINPLHYPDNMLSPQSLDLFTQALALFDSLALPVVSFIDTPGTNPMQSNQSFEVITAFKQLILAIHNYRYLTAGFIVGRAFGGATMLGFPKVFTGGSVYILDDADMGVMDKNTINDLAPATHQVAKPSNNFSDLLQANIADAVISRREMKDRLQEILNDYDAS